MPSRYARSLLNLLASDNPALKVALAARAGIQEQALQGQGDIPLNHYCQLFLYVTQQLQKELHGDQAADVRSHNSYRLLLESMTQVSNLESAIVRADTFFRTLGLSRCRTHVELKGGFAHWVFSFDDDTQKLCSPENFSMEGIGGLPGLIGHSTTLWIWYRIACWLTGSMIALEKIELCDDQPPQPQRYSALFSAPLIYRQKHFAVVFPRHYLSSPVVQNASSADHLLENFLQGLFDLDNTYDNTRKKISTLIGHDFSRPIPTINAVAKSLNMSTATLQRHLQKENTSYRKIKDDCLHKAAQDYLRQGDLAIKDIAHLLGFSDNSSFYRAFKKWTGMTPKQFRQYHH